MGIYKPPAARKSSINDHSNDTCSPRSPEKLLLKATNTLSPADTTSNSSTILRRSDFPQDAQHPTDETALNQRYGMRMVD